MDFIRDYDAGEITYKVELPTHVRATYVGHNYKVIDGRLEIYHVTKHQVGSYFWGKIKKVMYRCRKIAIFAPGQWVMIEEVKKNEVQTNV